jgi:glycosyltransferase involved in cell wall biosynthesis
MHAAIGLLPYKVVGRGASTALWFVSRLPHATKEGIRRSNAGKPMESSIPGAPGIPTLSVVVPLFNEEEVVERFHARLAPVMEALGLSWEVVYVDDGSRDGSRDVLERLAAVDARVGILALSRNFGKEAAMTAGIDVDLQDPPEIIARLVEGWREGYEVVYAQRTIREGETWLKRATAKAFYRIMGRIGPVQLPEDTGDFRLMSRRAVDALLQLRERHRMMKGLFAWIGFKSKAVRYVRAPRAAGSTKWNYLKLINLSVEGITGFTTLPLRVATFVGLLAATAALGYGGWIVLDTLVHGNKVPGYPSLLVAVLFFGGSQLIAVGVLGEYLGRIFDETKGRPLYLVERHLQAGRTVSA